MRVITTWILFMVSGILLAQQFPLTEIMRNGSDDNRINFVILSDGYTDAQLDTYIDDANNITLDLFNKSPFIEYKKYFNVYAIEVPSNESGANHPGTATDVDEPISPVMEVDNYFGSSFDKYHIHRLLVPSNTADIYSVLADSYAGYDQVIVLANSTEYGGSGGEFATTSLHPSASEIAIHEIGHSFAGLADEYWAGSQYAAEKPNMSSESDPNLVKWSEWIGQSDVNTYSYGTSGEAANWYRPHQSCEMRYLNQEFCPVCSERFLDKIYELVSPIDEYIPATSDLNYQGYPITFALNLVYPEPNTIKIIWTLNGVDINTNTESIVLDDDLLTQENNTLVAHVIDTTLLSKSYAPQSGYEFDVSWNVKNSVLPINLIDFTAINYKEYVELNWNTSFESNLEKFIVERSDDLVNYKPIGEINPTDIINNISSYKMFDYNPLEGKSYYRLKSVDFNGQFEYSPIRMVDRIAKFFYKIYPNPTQDIISLNYSLNSNENEFIIELINSNGKLISSITGSGQKGEHIYSIDLTNQISGTYFINIRNKYHVNRFKIIKI